MTASKTNNNSNPTGREILVSNESSGLAIFGVLKENVAQPVLRKLLSRSPPLTLKQYEALELTLMIHGPP